MNTNADKAQESKRQSVANGTSQKQSGGESTFQFVDNRPEAIVQRKLQEMARNSPQGKQLRTMQRMMNNSPQIKQATQLKKELFQGKSAETHVIQKFDAGIGAGWHIHHQDHVKYDSNNATRVNFAGRTRRQVGYQWEQVIRGNGLAGTKGNADFIACKTWIRNNI